MAFRGSFGREINQVLLEGNSCVKKVILNRPQRFNSITYGMICQMLKKLKEYENDSTVKLVILKGNGKAFCTGGDLMSFYKYTTPGDYDSGHWTFGALFYKKLLILVHLLATYNKPVVTLIDGMMMGAGAGLCMQAPYRIVTEKTVFAMPEAAIGSIPDVGASYFLSRLPGYFGEYLGLTGTRLDGATMVVVGLATHFVLSEDIHSLENALGELNSSDAIAISQLISKFVHKANKVKQDINAYHNRLMIVNKCFSRETVEDILLALEKEAENGKQTWIIDAIKSMKSACPASLKIFLKSVREGRRQSLEQCLVREYTIISHIIRGTVSNDLYEGIRAMLLDKDRKPRWQPPKLELVTQEIVDQCFSIVDDDGWEPLQLPSRSNLSDPVMKSKL